MDLIDCPTCGLPRVADDTDAPCPVCGDRVAELTLTAEPEPIPLAPAEPPLPEDGTARNWVLLGGTVAVGAAVVAGLLWFPRTDRPAEAPPSSGPVVAAVTPALLPVGPELAPPPRAGSLAPPSAVAVTAPTPPTPVADPPAEEPAEVVAVNRPGEVYRLPRLADGKRVKLVGQAKRLIAEGLDEGAFLDATGLTVEDVVFTGPIDGGTATVRTADGVVLFKGKVDGGAQVAVDAGTGFVAFTDRTAGGRDGSKIDGGSRVTITARTVYLGGAITGPDTHVLVTLAPRGALSFAGVGGTARLHYRTADPPPKVTRGEVSGRAEFKRVD